MREILTRYKGDIYEIYGRYTRGIGEIYGIYAGDIHEIYKGYTGDIYKIYGRHAGDIRNIYGKYTFPCTTFVLSLIWAYCANMIGMFQAAMQAGTQIKVQSTLHLEKFDTSSFLS